MAKRWIADKWDLFQGYLGLLLICTIVPWLVISLIYVTYIFFDVVLPNYEEIQQCRKVGFVDVWDCIDIYRK